MSDGKYVEGSYYFYAPNKGAAIFFAVAFLTSAIVHAWQASHYKCWKLTPLFPFCSLLFFAGFAIRAYGAFDYDNLEVYIGSLCITYAAPPLLELQNYHILGRALYYVPHQSPLHPGRVLTTFGFISFIIEGLNGWGASYSANQSLSHSEMEAGHALIKTSLLLQLVVATCFVSLAAMFHRRCVTHGVNNDRLKSTLLTLYISITLIIIRTIFRTVEYFGIASYKFDDPDFDAMSMSPLMRYEVFFCVFEAALMFCNNVMFNMRHPRRYLPENNRIYLSQDGVTEVEGPGYEDPRPLWRTILDPFDVVGMFRGKKGSTVPKFWEAQGPETK